MKIADIDAEKLSEGLGRCPKNPQGTLYTPFRSAQSEHPLDVLRPLTQYRALPEPVLAGRHEKGALAPFSAGELLERMLREPYVNRLSRHILTDGCAACSGIPRFY